MDQATPSTASANTLHCCVGVKQEVLAVGDPVSGSGAAEPLSNRRRGRRKADGEVHPGPGSLEDSVLYCDPP
jgi:hypothetical protein